MSLSENAKGAVFMTLSMLAFVINDALMKLLFIRYPLFEMVFLRGLVCLPLLLIVLKTRGLLKFNYSSAQWKLLLLRGFAEVMATVCFLSALKYLPLPNVTAILQIAPLAVTMAAALFLGESVGIRRWLAILIGFAGVLIVIRPGPDGFSLYSVYAVTAVLFVTLREIVTRKIPREVPSLLVSLVTALSVTTLAAAMLPFSSFEMPDMLSLFFVFCCGVAVLFGYLFSTMAMRVGELSFVSPFRYSAMIWAVILGIVVFNEAPQDHTIYGSIIIVLSGIYSFHRKRLKEAA